MDIRLLEPQALWSHFADLNGVPRASKKEERVVEFIINYGKRLNLQVNSDKAGNVVIKKPATPGMEDRQTVILQSHVDMVHQKNGDTDFDFDTQGIEMYIDGDWVRAHGTTLGADNGIGVAAIMSILSSSEIEHPAIEALFTVDEETGMTGAFELDASMLSGTILLNLDTEDDTELCIGCAGGVDTTSHYNYQLEHVPADSIGLALTIKGLRGGHSGMDIHKGRANANKLMNRLLCKLLGNLSFSLSSLDGGSLRNAIPRESTAIVAVPRADRQRFLLLVDEFAQMVREEYASLEPGLCIECAECSLPVSVMPASDFRKLTYALMALPNGVYRMSPDIDNLVEASSNLARVIVKDGVFITQSLQRSSVESTKQDIAGSVSAALLVMGCRVEQSGDYPGWKPNPASPVLSCMEKLYEQSFQHKAEVGACHAGLECGILGAHVPDLDMISFGPTIIGAHSPEERVSISSVAKFWKYLQSILANIPKR